LKACVSPQEKPSLCHKNGADSHAHIGNLGRFDMSRRIRIACPAAFYPLPQVKALAGSHGAAARVAAVERAPAALKVLCGNLEKLGLTAGLLADGAVVIAEHRRKDVLEDSYGALERTRILKQGDAALSFYAARPMR
jgi:hypothetical protein